MGKICKNGLLDPSVLSVAAIVAVAVIAVEADNGDAIGKLLPENELSRICFSCQLDRAAEHQKKLFSSPTPINSYNQYTARRYMAIRACLGGEQSDVDGYS